MFWHVLPAVSYQCSGQYGKQANCQVAACIAADAAYGYVLSFRESVEALELLYVLSVQSNVLVWTPEAKSLMQVKYKRGWSKSCRFIQAALRIAPVYVSQHMAS